MSTVFDKQGNELKTPVYLYPGKFLLEEVEERELKKTDFAREIGIQPGNLSELFEGKRNITARLAIRIEKALNISAEYWMGLQSAYDLAIARDHELV